jgi:hypothetical protein
MIISSAIFIILIPRFYNFYYRGFINFSNIKKQRHNLYREFAILLKGNRANLSSYAVLFLSFEKVVGKLATVRKGVGPLEGIWKPKSTKKAVWVIRNALKQRLALNDFSILTSGLGLRLRLCPHKCQGVASSFHFAVSRVRNDTHEGKVLSPASLSASDFALRATP